MSVGRDRPNLFAKRYCPRKAAHHILSLLLAAMVECGSAAQLGKTRPQCRITRQELHCFSKRPRITGRNPNASILFENDSTGFSFRGDENNRKTHSHRFKYLS